MVVVFAGLVLSSTGCAAARHFRGGSLVQVSRFFEFESPFCVLSFRFYTTIKGKWFNHTSTGDLECKIFWGYVGGHEEIS